jgi:hypothetical protein
MDHKGFSLIIVLLVVAVILVSGGIRYYEARYQQSQSQETHPVSVVPVATTTGVSPLTNTTTNGDRANNQIGALPEVSSALEN